MNVDLQEQTGARPTPSDPRAASSQIDQDPLWYKDALIYQIHVRSFYDSNGDGYGDFQGLREKLPYLEELGVNTLWLLPFYESPLRDDGYDIADYWNILPVHGELEDFKAFLNEAHARGMRVVTEMVLNHTSDQHAWFQEARQPGSEKRDWYVWSDTAEKYKDVRIIFTDTEHSNWTWDPGRRGVLLAPFFQPSTRPQLGQPRGRAGASRSALLLARHGRRWGASRRGTVSIRARGHVGRKPAGDSRRD